MMMINTDLEGLLELVAKKRPDLLESLLSALEFSPAGPSVGDLARRLGLGSNNRARDLAMLSRTTVAQLDRLEREHRHSWRHPREVVEAPNVAALLGFAYGRRDRVTKTHRYQRLDAIAHKLGRLEEDDRRQRDFERFLTEPVPAVDPGWLRDFLGDQRG